MTKKSSTPAIRFKGFTDTWEQRKFGDGMDLLTGYPFESEKFSDNGINLIRGMNVKRGYLDLSNSLCMKWKSSEGLEKYLLENEDILIQMDGALIGKSYAKIKETQLPALLVQRVTRARAIPEKSNSDFMYQTIQRDFLKYIILNKTDSAIPHLSLNDIREFPIRVPNLEEQKKIGEYFSNLDNLITLHQRKYDKLTNVKKSMLEKMFPKNGSNVPEIRFKGFTEAWEQRKVSELFRVTRGYVLAATQTETTKTDEKPYPVYSSQTKDKGLMGYYKDYLYEDAITCQLMAQTPEQLITEPESFIVPMFVGFCSQMK